MLFIYIIKVNYCWFRFIFYLFKGEDKYITKKPFAR